MKVNKIPPASGIHSTSGQTPEQKLSRIAQEIGVDFSSFLRPDASDLYQDHKPTPSLKAPQRAALSKLMDGLPMDRRIAAAKAFGISLEQLNEPQWEGVKKDLASLLTQIRESSRTFQKFQAKGEAYPIFPHTTVEEIILGRDLMAGIWRFRGGHEINLTDVP